MMVSRGDECGAIIPSPGDDRRREEQGEEEVEAEELDPRVQTELEKLNTRTEEINALEVQLEDAHALFRTLLTDSTAQLKALSKKLGSCIEKARPYYEALDVSQRAQKECQSAATHYQRASGVHAAAKETIALAEQRFLSNSTQWKFDNAWQEMLNHATIKVMEAEKEKTESEAEHLKRYGIYKAAEAEVHRLEKKLGKFVTKSAPYFEQKDIFNKALEAQKARVQDLQEKVVFCKKQYSQSLRNLEVISESIHAQRALKQPREPGVGAELSSLPSFDLDMCDGASVGALSSLGSSSITKSMDGDGMSEKTADELEGLSLEPSPPSKPLQPWEGSQLPSIEPVPSPPKSPASSRFLKSITRSLSVPTQILFKQSSVESCPDEDDAVPEVRKASLDASKVLGDSGQSQAGRSLLNFVKGSSVENGKTSAAATAVATAGRCPEADPVLNVNLPKKEAADASVRRSSHCDSLRAEEDESVESLRSDSAGVLL